MKLNKKKWLRLRKILQRWLLHLKKKKFPLTLNHILEPSFFKCKGPQCQLMWLVHLKGVVFNLCQKRRHNLVHWKYSFDFPFCTKWDLRMTYALINWNPDPPPRHPGPRWGFDLTSLQILANSHPTGAYWLVKPPPRWGNLFNSLTDFINISFEFSTSLLTNLLEQKGKYDNRPRYKYDISRIPVCIREPKYRMDRTKQ